MLDDGGLQALREAARLSPDNLPLRRHLADQLLKKGYLAEAEAEFRAALVLAPKDTDVVAGLAEAFVRQSAHGEALAVLEPFLADFHAYPPRMGILAARALLGEGEQGKAAYRYYEAISRDPSLADPELAERLPIPIVPSKSAPAAPPAPAAPAPAYAALAGAPAPSAADSAPGGAEVERSKHTFADVAGMEAVKEALRVKLLLPIQQPELFAAYGKRAGGGVLLYGPPGAGKTHLARAAAGELGASFVNVGLADILDMYVGSSERNLRATFDLARRNRPCVLFFDEVDALAARRSDMRQAHTRQLVNQFLAELDGVDQDANEGVLVLAATNAPWYIDVAFRRPGRFDQLVFVPPPDTAARAAILRILCRDKPLAEMDFDAVARATEHYVGADLKGLVDRAVEVKLQQSISAGRAIPLSTADLLAAAQGTRPSSVREWMATARNYVLHANESGAWDELMPWIKAKW
ncbi:ATPase family protein associated with various cellular activities (AAA) [Nonomuraea polychroma]|uniref:ATPase family protein associated with various cellular activities (AAA) n=1 Tax=Nonomuraea polychroma TaxID=46176 RepID=A0A438MJ46_9ACTN|nr:ATP-binding protein [Nonomuraea polychroma]RVX45576.1 ATPase family protein associated with various cellular activities (AAA) [Nonomuraea polychroma]